jgi:hypothetical protein
MSKGRNKRELLPGQVMSLHYEDDPDNWVRVTGHCVVTKQPYSVRVLGKELYKWLEGKQLIQHCFNSDVSGDTREFLMTGISPDGWDIMFPSVLGEEDE